MPTSTVRPGNDDGAAATVLQDALGRLDTVTNELLLDFSSVRRVDGAALRTMELLVSQAHAKSVTVVLSGVNVEVYKVLKLVKVAAQFRFQT